ncbi:MAG TPA: hypothetical protein VK281_00030 [Xanthobacteraceae bacterium]|nr:hypothetical protein [Xanthobacteraceae bacterium]
MDQRCQRESVRILRIERAQQWPDETVENADQGESSAEASMVQRTLSAWFWPDKSDEQIVPAPVAI